jgi:hypothetical protein
MSAARSPRDTRARPAADVDLAYRRPEMTHLRARRRDARRRQRVARLDLALGVLVALVLFVVSPGLAVTAIVALLTLLVCGVSLLVGRRRRHRPRRAVAGRRRPQAPARGRSRSSGGRAPGTR